MPYEDRNRDRTMSGPRRRLPPLAASASALAAGLVSLVAIAAALGGCSPDARPAVEKLTPLSGSTAVDVSTQPSVEVAVAANLKITQASPGLLLFDVTAGGRKQLAGTIEVSGRTAKFMPKGGLSASRDYELVMQRASIVGERLEDSDASEWPAETIVWPLRVRFSTRTAPRVRAVYLDDKALFVRFSQPMNQVVTAKQFKLVDQLKQAVKLAGPVLWVGDDSSSARLDLPEALDPAGLYTLTVSASARGADGAPLDGDGDGRLREKDDSFSVQFTGSQRVVLSRFPKSEK